MDAKRDRTDRHVPERADGVRAFRGILIGVVASILLFWAPLVIVLVLVLR